jgi:3-hydroxyacyl-[acyl-carrier-protein] dehydratase
MSKVKDAILESMIQTEAYPEPDTIVRQFNFDRNFIGFSGHFPEYPVLPAFVQMMAAQTVIETHLSKPLELLEIINAKFLIPIEPGRVIEVRCRAVRDHWEAVLYCENEVAASFRMRLIESRGG